MEAGFVFGKYNVSNEHGKEMREAAENSLSEQSTTKVTLECKTPDYKENIGVYH